MRKGFTLIEIIISLVIGAIIAAIGAREYIIHLQNKRLESFLNNVNEFINYAVIDPYTGYANGTGGYCSSSYDYTGLDACRAVKCAKVENAFVLNSSDCSSSETTTENPGSYYIENLLLEDTDGQGCRLYAKADKDDSSIFYIFIDCSDISNARLRQRVEELLDYDMRTNFNVVYQGTYRKATDIDLSEDGTDNDGKIAFKFKK